MTIVKYLIENLDITKKDFQFILFIALRSDLDLDIIKYIIEKLNIVGAVLKNDKHENVGEIYNSLIILANIWELEGEVVQYLNMIKSITDKDIILK